MKTEDQQKKKSEQQSTDNIVVATLKRQYFDLLRKERIGRDKKLSQEIDALEAAIRREIEQQKP